MTDADEVFGLWTVDPELRDIIGWIGTVITVLFFLSPSKVVYGFYTKGSTEDYTGEIFLSGFFNCSIWIYYTWINELAQPFWCNIIGCLIQIVFLGTFLIYAKDPKERIRLAKIGVVSFGVIGLLCFFTNIYGHPNFVFKGMSTTSFTAGLCANIYNVLMYASPLAVMKTVVATKSVEFMPLPVTLGSMACSICWATYGTYVGDVWIIAPNYLGCLLGIAQITLYTCYYKAEPLVQMESAVKYEKLMIDDEESLMVAPPPQEEHSLNNSD
jgi:solute carrier family 50 protein (sugar transporter)